jgi:hypothetical protein
VRPGRFESPTDADPVSRDRAGNVRGLLGYVGRGLGVVVVALAMLAFNTVVDHAVLASTWVAVGFGVLGLAVLAVVSAIYAAHNLRRVAVAVTIGLGLGVALVAGLVVARMLESR